MKRSARILNLALEAKNVKKNIKEFQKSDEELDEECNADSHLSSPVFYSDFLDSDSNDSYPSASDKSYCPSNTSPLSNDSSLSSPGVENTRSITDLNPLTPFQLNENIDSLPSSSNIENISVVSQARSSPLLTKNSKKKISKNRIRRKHRCTFCDQTVGDFARHLIRIHDDEISVQEIMRMDKKSKKRKEAINKLRKEGDFCSNEIVPVALIPTANPNYIACKYCRGFYSKKSLRRHVKKCYYNPDPKKRCMAQTEGQTLMSGHFGPNDVLRTTGILNMLKADDVALVAKRDPIICEVARRYIRSHKEKHLLLVAKRYMRRLARLLIEVRNIKKNQNLKLLDILAPTSFRDLINGTKSIAEYDDKTRTYKSPSLAQQMNSLLKHAINTAYSLEVQKSNSDKEKITKLKELNTLIENDWASEISSEAGQNLNMNRFNKPTLIPATQDIMTFQKYLDKHIDDCHVQLAKNPNNMKAYRELNEAVFCSLMILNKRRVGELQRMTLESFLQNYQSSSSKEFEKALGESEKILYRSFKRVVIRGKRGRGVPVLFDKKMVQIIEYLISIRNNFELNNNIYLFGIPKTENPINGFLVMRKQAKLALGDVSKVSLLTSTKLRKHLATIGQILKLEKNDLEQLANFMGHTEKTHADFYRLPSDVYQTAKVSKLLMLSKSQVLDERFKGKSLSEIEIEDCLEECDESGDDPSDEETTVENVTDPQIKEAPRVKQGTKRRLVAWTEEQKKVTENFFAKHIKRKIPPKKKEVEELVSKNKELFKNKEWQKIKIYVCNKYAKK